MKFTQWVLDDGKRSGLTEGDLRRMQVVAYEQQDFELPRYRIPYLNFAGKVISFHRDRFHPDHMPVDKNGEPTKYKQPAGVAPHAYLPPFADWRAVARDAKRDVILTEGEKKAACACKHGFPTIGLGGVDCFPVPNLGGFEWKGRRVCIAFDSDAAQNGHVLGAEKRAAEWLRSLGAEVSVVRLPSDGGAKVGLDDYIVAHGPNALRALIDAPGASAPAPLLSPGAPLESAKEFVASAWTSGTHRTLHHRSGVLYAWRGDHYAMVEDGDMRAKAYRFLDAAVTRRADGSIDPFHPTRARVNDMLDALQSECNLSGSDTTPFWIEPRRNAPPAAELIALRNGLLHVPRRKLLQHGPDFFNLNALGFDYSDRALQPRRWLAFLDSLWRGDTDSIATLQEWFGYYVSGDCSQQKILLLVGPKRAGKGTIASTLESLLGKGNVAWPTTQSLTTNFGLWPLMGKALAIIGDARLGGRVDQHALAEKLLGISGEDRTTIDRKFSEPLTVHLGTRFLLVSNEVPRIADASAALASRFIVLKFDRSFYGKEDLGLKAALRAELPGIFLWALEGLRRLQKRGHFVQPTSAKEEVELLADLGSPITTFLRDCCVVRDTARVQRGMLYASWLAWCQGHGRAHPGTLEMFARDLRAALPALSDTQVREDNKRIRYYVGVGLASAESSKVTGTGNKAKGHGRKAKRGVPSARRSVGAGVPPVPVKARLHSGAGTGGTGKSDIVDSTRTKKASRSSA